MSNPGDSVRNSLVKSFKSNEGDNPDRNGYSNMTNTGRRQKRDINQATSYDDTGSHPNNERRSLLENRNESSVMTNSEVRFLRRDGLKPVHFAAYAVGHVYNDL